MPEALHSSADLSVMETEARRTVMLCLRKPADLAKLGQVLGVTLPQACNTANGVKPRAIWAGPDRWLVLGSTATLSEIEDAASAAALLAVEVGEGWFSVTVEGSRAREFLARGSSLDFHPRRFRPGQTAMTLFAQLPVVIDQPEESRFCIYFERSYQHYVRTWIWQVVSNLL